jgi:hypothetical protein
MLKDAGAQLLGNYLKRFTYYLISQPPPTNHAAGKLQSAHQNHSTNRNLNHLQYFVDHFPNLTINLTLESYYAQKNFQS